MACDARVHVRRKLANAVPFDVTLTGLGYSIPPKGALRQTRDDIFPAFVNNEEFIARRYLVRYLAARLSFLVKPKS